jgi:hypothetical protein
MGLLYIYDQLDPTIEPSTLIDKFEYLPALGGLSDFPIMDFTMNVDTVTLARYEASVCTSLNENLSNLRQRASVSELKSGLSQFDVLGNEIVDTLKNIRLLYLDMFNKKTDKDRCRVFFKIRKLAIRLQAQLRQFNITGSMGNRLNVMNSREIKSVIIDELQRYR